MVGFELSSVVVYDCIGCCVGFVEVVVGEFFEKVEDFGGFFFVDVVFGGVCFEFWMFGVYCFFDFFIYSVVQ